MAWRPTGATLFLERTIAPTAGDDEHEGFLVGDIWIDEVNDAAYICLDNSVGAAVWGEAASGTPSTFLDLTDTPSSYSGKGGDLVKVNAAESALEFTSYYEGSFEVLNNFIAAASTYTIECTLPRSDYTQGYLLMHIPVSAPYTNKRRLSATIIFTTDEADSQAQTGRLKTQSVVGYYGITYYVHVWWQEGWSFNTDGQLGYNNGWRISGVGQLIIRKVWIDGDKLKIQFDNTHATNTVRMDVEGRFHVY